VGSILREVFMGAVALVCVVLAILRVSPSCSSLDREKLDATVLGFLLVPFAWVLARGAKVLKVGTEGFEYEALEKTVQETHAAVVQTKAAVENNAARIEETNSALHATQLAVAHGVGGRQTVHAKARRGLGVAESQPEFQTTQADPRDPHNQQRKAFDRQCALSPTRHVYSSLCCRTSQSRLSCTRAPCIWRVYRRCGVG
jgi:hypothetical protein